MYIVSFYESGNSQNIPTIWPSQIQPFSPAYIADSGYPLATGGFYVGELTSNVVNSNKIGFGIGESQVCMTQSEYDSYINTNYPTYENWRNGILNPEVKEKTIAEIKAEAQNRIVGMLGFSPSDVSAWTAKQINMNARASEVILGILQGTATDSDKAELLAMKAFFSVVKSIRNHSNYLESAINSGQNVSITEGWPV